MISLPIIRPPAPVAHLDKLLLCYLSFMEKVVVLSGGKLDDLVKDAGIVEIIKKGFPDMGELIEGSIESFHLEVRNGPAWDEWSDERSVDLVFVSPRMYRVFPDGKLSITIYDATCPLHWGDNVINLPENLQMALYDLAMSEVDDAPLVLIDAGGVPSTLHPILSDDAKET